jgi:tryptophan synthase alpha subunit
MGYFNPMMAYGFDKLAAETKEAGADGFIIVDLPVSVDHRKTHWHVLYRVPWVFEHLSSAARS